MIINGIKQIRYLVDDLDTSRRFYEQFGLPLHSTSSDEAVFLLPDAATVRLATRAPEEPKTDITVETTWGLQSADDLQRLCDDLARDHTLRTDAAGDVHLTTAFGLPLALGHFERRPVTYSPDPVNAPERIVRLNQWRKWRFRAQPKTINHVVYGVDDYVEAWEFFRHRLGFKLSDHSRGLGVFLRANGRHEHHNLFLANCHFRGPGKPGFQHACFGVEDVDELMAGANHMARHGHTSQMGLGRHRIASALFYYLACPAGGEAEYGADTDYLDDGWVPREWDPKFGYIGWATELPAFMMEEAARDVRLLESEDDVRVPDSARHRRSRPS